MFSSFQGSELNVQNNQQTKKYYPIHLQMHFKKILW